MEEHTKDDVRWSFARGVVIGVFGTCSAIIALLELASVIKGLME